MTNKKGFTLIELLVVIAIIGLLSTLAVVALNSARQKSRDSKRVADIKQIQTALELYFADKSGYPYVSTAGITLGSTAAATSLCDTGFATAACTGTTYMGLVPKAPSPSDNTCPTAATGSTDANPYKYVSTAATIYSINFCLGGNVGDLSAGIRTADQTGIK